MESTHNFKEPILHPEVQKLCDKYKEDLLLFCPHSDFDKNDKRFYVYIWYTNSPDNVKKVFYVGKGTGSRYKHILDEIKEEKGKGWLYKMIQNKSGVDYNFLIKDITAYEAELYEFCMMREYTLHGEVLLNFVDMPLELFDEIDETTPNIEKDAFYERYMDDHTIPLFDNVTEENLIQTCFCDAHLIKTDENIANRDYIIQKIEEKGGRVYKRKGKLAKSIIIQGSYPYCDWLRDHENNLMVYSSKDVIDFISKNWQ